MDFKVGDKVVRNYRCGYGSVSIGTIIKITPKRKDIVVDYGSYEEKYNKDGWTIGGDIWGSSRINILTPKIEKEIRDAELVRKCKRLFELKSVVLTVEQAEKILEILKE